MSTIVISKCYKLNVPIQICSTPAFSRKKCDNIFSPVRNFYYTPLCWLAASYDPTISILSSSTTDGRDTTTAQIQITDPAKPSHTTPI